MSVSVVSSSTRRRLLVVRPDTVRGVCPLCLVHLVVGYSSFVQILSAVLMLITKLISYINPLDQRF